MNDPSTRDAGSTYFWFSSLNYHDFWAAIRPLVLGTTLFVGYYVLRNFAVYMDGHMANMIDGRERQLRDTYDNDTRYTGYE